MNDDNASIYINDWNARIVRKTSYSGYRNIEKSYLQINDGKQTIMKYGDIINDFLCLCKYEQDRVILFEERLEKWLFKYGCPLISDQEMGKVIDQNRNMIIVINGQFCPIKPSERTGFHTIMHDPNRDIERYQQAIKYRFREIALSLQYQTESLAPLPIDFVWSVSPNQSIYLFELDIYSLIMFDLFNVYSHKKTLRKCSQCNALFIPIRGLTHCVGGCRPISKMSKKELENYNLKSTSISSNKKRSALIKKLKRQGKDRSEMREILISMGFAPLREYNKEQ